jgi:hypothetical protein
VSKATEEADFLRRQAQGLAIFSTFCLALALLFYLLYRCRLHDRPGDEMLLVLVTVPMTCATTGFANAWRQFRKAQRGSRAVEPEP